jgi:hypothetical protein
VLAPAVAWRRRRLVRRRGRRVTLAALARRHHPGLVGLSLELHVPFLRLGAVAEALGGAAGEVAEGLGLDLGVIGIVAGEEPVLTTLRPRPVDVAERFVRNLLAGESHRRPHLWLALTPGSYLAEAVDPYQPLLLAAGELPSPLLRRARVRAGLLVARHDEVASCRLALCLYAPVADLRRALATSRRWLDGFAD